MHLTRFTGSMMAIIHRLMHDRRGNILMIFAFSLMPLLMATGMGIDYSAAMRIQSRLNAAADAAVLSATSQQMMSQSISSAKNRAKEVFRVTAGTIPGLTIDVDDPTQLSIDVRDTAGNSNQRTATITFKGTSANSFAGILGLATLPVKGAAGSIAKTAPDVDFYILLDTSGSMALPATSAGLKLLTEKTGGCAFACHSTNDAKARDKWGNLVDYYGVAVSYGIPLRSDEAQRAVQSMMSTAASTARSNNANYRAALYTFAAADARANNSFNPRQTLTATLGKISTAVENADTSFYYKNGCPTENFCNDDRDTASSDAFTRMNSIIPAPGNGTKQVLDQPQAVLFVITDGMRDELRPNGKPEVGFDENLCSTIKNRNIRIAVLYTEYLKESLSDNWSKTNVLPNLPKVEPALRNCASNGLYYKVTTDEDISAALNTLLQKAIEASRLTQ
jgi:Flp pilus assembly protein TadG